MKRILLLTFFLFSSSGVICGTLSQTGSFLSNQPIETRINLGLFGLLGGGMDYKLEGRPVSRYEDFKTIIYSENDFEASDLIREAHEAHFAAWMLYFSGLALGVDVGLSFKPAPILKVDWFDRIASGFVGAQIFWALGAILDTNAEGQKYNAVQRYNHLLQRKEQEEAFFDLSTSSPLNGQGLCLDLERAF